MNISLFALLGGKNIPLRLTKELEYLDNHDIYDWFGAALVTPEGMEAQVGFSLSELSPLLHSFSSNVSFGLCYVCPVGFTGSELILPFYNLKEPVNLVYLSQVNKTTSLRESLGILDDRTKKLDGDIVLAGINRYLDEGMSPVFALALVTEQLHRSFFLKALFSRTSELFLVHRGVQPVIGVEKESLYFRFCAGVSQGTRTPRRIAYDNPTIWHVDGMSKVEIL